MKVAQASVNDWQNTFKTCLHVAKIAKICSQLPTVVPLFAKFHETSIAELETLARAIETTVGSRPVQQSPHVDL
eukprot:m.46582 g.46582  ORF g.46582 m.46582 type:complete len:74 (-) comp17538_c0_seq2:229-450(-)